MHCDGKNRLLIDDAFEIPVMYKDQELLFPSKLQTFGFVHKFKVDVFGPMFFFETDNNGTYRALIDQSNLEQAKKLTQNF